jgi:hypothetical protein
MMARRRVMLTFPPELSAEPIIYNLGQQFGIVTNLRRADISLEQGWTEMEIEGEEEEIQEGIMWLTGKGVRVEPLEGDTAGEHY